MLRRPALILNDLVLLTGGAFAWGGAYALAGVCLLLGGLNIVMLRQAAQERPGVSFWPIVVNLALMSVGNLGTFVGAGYYWGTVQPQVTIELQRRMGLLLLGGGPVLSIAGIVTMVVCFQRLLEARRSLGR